jgi:uncharacterized membrane protein YphA (DoxX/SURF4 family)
MGRARAVVVALVVGVAGTLKLIDLPVFAESLAAWTLLPRGLVPPVTIAVPAAELALSLCWLLGIARRRCEWMMCGLLIGFTGVYALQWIVAEAPPCGCLGVLARRLAAVEQAQWLLARNFVLIALAAYGLYSNRTTAGARHSAERG